MRRHIERTGDEFREGAEDFDRLHKGFHTALLTGCGSKRLLAAHFRGRESHVEVIFRLLTLELWAQRFHVGERTSV